MEKQLQHKRVLFLCSFFYFIYFFFKKPSENIRITFIINNNNLTIIIPDITNVLLFYYCVFFYCDKTYHDNNNCSIFLYYCIVIVCISLACNAKVNAVEGDTVHSEVTGSIPGPDASLSGSFRALRLPPTVQRHAHEANWARVKLAIEWLLVLSRVEPRLRPEAAGRGSSNPCDPECRSRL